MQLRSFIISLIEKGRTLYGVGTERQMCILLDRGGTVIKNGEHKIEMLNMSILPDVVELVRTIVATLQVIYILLYFTYAY